MAAQCSVRDGTVIGPGPQLAKVLEKGVSEELRRTRLELVKAGGRAYVRVKQVGVWVEVKIMEVMTGTGLVKVRAAETRWECIKEVRVEQLVGDQGVLYTIGGSADARMAAAAAKQLTWNDVHARRARAIEDKVPKEIVENEMGMVMTKVYKAVRAASRATAGWSEVGLEGEERATRRSNGEALRVCAQSIIEAAAESRGTGLGLEEGEIDENEEGEVSNDTGVPRYWLVDVVGRLCMSELSPQETRTVTLGEVLDVSAAEVATAVACGNAGRVEVKLRLARRGDQHGRLAKTEVVEWLCEVAALQAAAVARRHKMEGKAAAKQAELQAMQATRRVQMHLEDAGRNASINAELELACEKRGEPAGGAAKVATSTDWASFFFFNPNGVGVEWRDKASQSELTKRVGKATLQPAMDQDKSDEEIDEANEDDENIEDEEDKGDGRDLRSRPSVGLEDVIEMTKVGKYGRAAFFGLSETQAAGKRLKAVQGHLRKAGYRSVASTGVKGAKREEVAGVMFCYDPERVMVNDKEVIVPGRVLRVSIQMLEDDSELDVIVVYMSVDGKQGVGAAELFKEWAALTEAVCKANGNVIVGGDFNAETAKTLLKQYGKKADKGEYKRKAEEYFVKLMDKSIMEEAVLTRLGRETTTSVRVVEAASEEGGEARIEEHTIDHILFGDALSARLRSRRTIVQSRELQQHHHAVAGLLMIVKTERVATDEKRRPKLSKMPVQKPPKRTKERSAVDSTDEEGSDEFTIEGECDDEGGKIGWRSYEEQVVKEVTKGIERYVLRKSAAGDEAAAAIRAAARKARRAREVNEQPRREANETANEVDPGEKRGKRVKWADAIVSEIRTYQCDSVKSPRRLAKASIDEGSGGEHSTSTSGTTEEARDDQEGGPADEEGGEDEETTAAIAKVRRAAERRYEDVHGEFCEVLGELTIAEAAKLIKSSGRAATGRFKLSEEEKMRRAMEAWQHIKEDVREMQAVKINFSNTKVLPARYTYRSSLVVPKAIKELFDEGCGIHDPAKRKQIEVDALSGAYATAKKKYDETRAQGRASRINEFLDESLTKETGYAARAFKQMKVERPGAMSEKRDRVKKGPLVALKKGKGLLTGAACDEEVADQVAANNREQVVNLEAVGHAIDRLGLPAVLDGAPTARLAGKAYQLHEEQELRARRQRGIDERRRRAEAKAAEVGEWCVVGELGVVSKQSRGRVRVRVDGAADTSLASCFRRDGSLEQEECYTASVEADVDIFTTGDNPYVVARRHHIPEQMVVPWRVGIEKEKKIDELNAMVERCVLHGERIELLVERRHTKEESYAHEWARYINSKTEEQLDELERQDKKVIEEQRRAAEEEGADGGSGSSKEGGSGDDEGGGSSGDNDGDGGGNGDGDDAGDGGDGDDAGDVEGEEAGGSERGQGGRVADDEGGDDDVYEGMYGFLPREMRKYWEETMPIKFDEEGVCIDERMAAMACLWLTPERVKRLAEKVTAKLATGVDEFSSFLIKRAPEKVAEMFAGGLKEAVSTLTFPEKWKTWHASLLPKAGKDRRTLKGYREVWVQSHLWKLVTACTSEEVGERVEATRAWINAGFEAKRGCAEQARALRQRIELAMIKGGELHIYFQDYSQFFPSISRMLTAFMSYMSGVKTEMTAMVRELQDRVQGAFVTARGPTRLSELLKGCCVGCPLGPVLSLIVATLVQRGLQRLVAGTPLPGPMSKLVSLVSVWFADDKMGADEEARVIQCIIDVSITLSTVVLELEVGHDEVEASKSASMSTKRNKKGKMEQDEDTKFWVAIGDKGANLRLARASKYRYLGSEFIAALMDGTTEEQTVLKMIVLIELLSNLGGAAADQLIEGINLIMQGTSIFAARAAMFREEAAVRVDRRALEILANHGHRLRHTRAITSHLALGLGHAYATVAAATIDEQVRALGGRDGEPARATDEQLWYMVAAMLGWRPSSKEPTAYDFEPHKRWRAKLSEQLSVESVMKIMGRFELKFRSTGVASQAASGAHVGKEVAVPEESMLFARVESITLDVWLHSQGMARIEDIWKGMGELASVDELEEAYGPIERGWTAKQRARVKYLLTEARRSEQVTKWIEEHGGGENTEMAAMRRRRRQQRAVVRGEVEIEEVEWKRVDEKSEKVMYVVKFKGEKEARTVSEEQIEENMDQLEGTYAAAHGGKEEARAWLDGKLSTARREPQSFRHHLEDKLGEEGAASLYARARGPQRGDEAMEAKVEIVDQLMVYAELKNRGKQPSEHALSEQRVALKELKFDSGSEQTAFPTHRVKIKTKAKGKGSDKEAEGSGDAGETKAEMRVGTKPTPEDVRCGRATIDTTSEEAKEHFDEIDWGKKEKLWLEEAVVKGSDERFDLPTTASERPMVALMARVAEMETNEGLEYEMEDGQTLNVKVLADEALKIGVEKNKELALEMAKLDKQRGGYDMCAATDAARSEDKGDGTTPPRVGCGVYFGYSRRRSTTIRRTTSAHDLPMMDARALPPDWDINAGEIMGIIMVLEHALAQAGTKREEMGESSKYHVLVLTDSSNALTVLEAGWRDEDLRATLGQTYGLLIERACWVRAELAKVGGSVDVMRLASHNGYIPNVIADAVAVAAAKLKYEHVHLGSRCRVAVLLGRGGALELWREKEGDYWSEFAFDARIAKTMKKHVHRSLMKEEAQRVMVTHKIPKMSAAEVTAELAAMTIDELEGEEVMSVTLPELVEKRKDTLSEKLVIAKRDVQAIVDGEVMGASKEEGYYVVPIADYSRLGIRPEGRATKYDKALNEKLAKSRGGGMGSRERLTTVGVRQVMLNYDQTLLVEARDVCPICEETVRCDVRHFWHECKGGVGCDAKMEVVDCLQEISLAVEAIEPFRDGADDFQAEARWARVAAAAPPSRSVTGDYVWHVFMQIAGGCMSKPAEAAIDETRRQYVGAGGDFIDEDDADWREVMANAKKVVRRAMYKKIKEQQEKMATVMREALSEYVGRLRGRMEKLKQHCGRAADVGKVIGDEGWTFEYARQLDAATGEEVREVSGVAMRETAPAGAAKRHTTVAAKRDAAKSKESEAKEGGESERAKMSIEEERSFGPALLERIRRGFAPWWSDDELAGAEAATSGESARATRARERESARAARARERENERADRATSDDDSDDGDADDEVAAEAAASGECEEATWLREMRAAAAADPGDSQEGAEAREREMRRGMRRLVEMEGGAREAEWSVGDVRGEIDDDGDDDFDSDEERPETGGESSDDGSSGSETSGDGSDSDVSGDGGKGRRRGKQAVRRKRRGAAAMATKARAAATAIEGTTNSSCDD